MKILFYFGHPAQYLFLRATIKNLIENKHDVIILIKTKDVLEDILKRDHTNYINILPTERGFSKLSIIISLFKRIIKMFPIIVKTRPNLLVGGDASIAWLGKIMLINRIIVGEDDYDTIRALASITYPFTQTILCPEVCSVGKYVHKKVGYHGYMKLGYLHPSVFRSNDNVKKKYQLEDNYILFRLARLSAHHDFGIKNISETLLKRLIETAGKKSFTVHISSEGKLDDKFKKHQLIIDPSDMHSIMAEASLFVSNSQSMSVEAAVLGTPSIRVSDFAGKISVLEELEHKYGLTYGINPSDEHGLLEKFNALTDNTNLKETFQARKMRMLADKIDVTSFLTWFLSNYPTSREIMIKNPDCQNIFK
jgi:uncharacterized protein